MKLEPSAIQLRFVPLDRLLLHEEDDPLRVKWLMHSLQHDSKLRNPPLVAAHHDCYIVLDGATRTTALREMGYRDVLVQIVDYSSGIVCLTAWHHVLAGLPHNRLLASLADVEGITLQAVDAVAADRLLATRQIMACVAMANGQRFAVLCKGDNCQRANLLCRLVAEYRGKAEVHRTVEFDLPLLMGEYPHLTAVILFPTFLPDEVTEIALNGAKLPMGITRHVVAGRALGLDIPLDRLTGDQPLDVKNQWLNEQIARRLKANKIRLYQEPVFVFDE